MKKVIDRGKRSKMLSEVKPVEKSAQSFLEISPVQKEVLASLHINCEAMHMSTRILSD